MPEFRHVFGANFAVSKPKGLIDGVLCQSWGPKTLKTYRSKEIASYFKGFSKFDSYQKSWLKSRFSAQISLKMAFKNVH